jgi:hypothetical protein
MDLLRVLRHEESKLLQVFNKVDGQLKAVRTAINALASNSSKPHVARSQKLKGRKLSAAHRAAIKRGIAKAKAKNAGGGKTEK